MTGKRPESGVLLLVVAVVVVAMLIVVLVVVVVVVVTAAAAMAAAAAAEDDDEEEKLEEALVMAATIQYGNFCFLACCLKNVKIKIYRIIMLPVVLCGCETWSLTLREEPRVKVLEIKVLKRILDSRMI
jgi:uncharacterized membrane protein YjgN (DUF898 family)